MKKTFTTLLLALTAMMTWAQTSALELLKADPKRSFGTDYPYHFTDAKLTASPAGYEPFYIAHYSRHGSRYFWSDFLYKGLDSLMTKAHERHQLTAEGEAFYNKFTAAKQELFTGWSELTQLGWEQQIGRAHV